MTVSFGEGEDSPFQLITAYLKSYLEPNTSPAQNLYCNLSPLQTTAYQLSACEVSFRQTLQYWIGIPPLFVGVVHFSLMYGVGLPARETNVGADDGVPGTSANKTVRVEQGPTPMLFLTCILRSILEPGIIPEKEQDVLVLFLWSYVQIFVPCDVIYSIQNGSLIGQPFYLADVSRDQLIVAEFFVTLDAVSFGET